MTSPTSRRSSPPARTPWVGVDLDGTLATQPEGAFSFDHVGDPIPLMVARVRMWLSQGRDVRIVTARVAPASCALNDVTSEQVKAPIRAWCQAHLGAVLPITCSKDMGMVELWDDRSVQLIPNTGLRADGRAD